MTEWLNWTELKWSCGNELQLENTWAASQQQVVSNLPLELEWNLGHDSATPSFSFLRDSDGRATTEESLSKESRGPHLPLALSVLCSSTLRREIVLNSEAFLTTSCLLEQAKVVTERAEGVGRSLSYQHSTGWTRTLASWVMTCSLPIDCSAAVFLAERDFGPEDVGLKKCLIKGHPWQYLKSWRAVVHCETVGSCYFSLLCGWIRCSVSFYLCVSSLPNFW